MNCDRRDEHPPHNTFYGWPRQQGICDGKSTSTRDMLVDALLDTVHREVIVEVKELIRFYRDNHCSPGVPYNAMNNLLLEVERRWPLTPR
jgi:hypothetical protein